VITSGWDVVRRPDDDEAVGYLVPDGDLVVPVTLVGTPLGTARTGRAAAALLFTAGLAALDGRWWCWLPDVLPRGVLDVSEPEPGWEWRPVVLVEVSPTGCRVRPEWPDPQEFGAQAALPLPVGDLLLLEPPA
jgi:hypothetical protein